MANTHFLRRYFFVFFLSIIFNTSLVAANYYVDKDATGNNSGTSWTNAWKSFSDINWNSIQPGDVIYISGGSVQKVYTEKLNILKSGSPNNPITITKGIDPGHDGEVIIDGQYSRLCIESEGNSNLVISYLTVDKASGAGSIRIRNGNNVVVEHIKGNLRQAQGVVFFQNMSNSAMRFITVTTDSGSFSSQTDGLYLQWGNNNIVENCWIKLRNDHNSPHVDCIQATQEKNLIIRNNYCENVAPTASNNKQGIYITDNYGTNLIYNNVVLLNSNAFGTALSFEMWSANGGVVEAYNNTVIVSGGSPNVFRVSDHTGTNTDRQAIVKNNIFIRLVPGNVAWYPSSFNNTNQCDNNLYYAPNTTEVIYHEGSANDSFSSWQSKGFDINGLNTDPLFSDPFNYDFNLSPDSPALDQGADLNSIFNEDINGTPRPQGSGWDIGAYELVTGPDIIPPKVTGANAPDITTLIISFSERIQQPEAENTNNFSISGGITVNQAVLSQNQKKVELTISELTEGTQYTVTVSNVKDLAGNIISPEHNSADFESPPSSPGGNKLQIIGVTASSTDDPNYGPELTIDGQGYYDNPDSRWAAIPMPQYLIFDFGTTQLLKETHFSFFGWDFGRIYEYSVFISEDSTNWVEVLSHEFSAPQEWTIKTLPQPQAGRFVKLLFISSNQATQGQEWAHLWEAELWGPEPTEVDTENNPPSTYKLYQNYPNPFNPSTTISFVLPKDSHVSLTIYNTIGQQIAELVNDNLPAGTYKFDYNAGSNSSGVYLYRFEADNFVDIKKMTLLK